MTWAVWGSWCIIPCIFRLSWLLKLIIPKELPKRREGSPYLGIGITGAVVKSPYTNAGERCGFNSWVRKIHLEKAMASMGSHKVGHDWSDLAAAAAAVSAEHSLVCLHWIYELLWGIAVGELCLNTFGGLRLQEGKSWNSEVDAYLGGWWSL